MSLKDKVAVCAVLAMGMLLGPGEAIGGNTSPVGRWETIDDETGRAKAVVHVWKQDGTLRGKIEKLFPKPGADPNPRTFYLESG